MKRVKIKGWLGTDLSAAKKIFNCNSLIDFIEFKGLTKINMNYRSVDKTWI